VISIEDGATVAAKSGVLVRSDNAGTGSGNTGAGVTTLTLTADKLSGNLITGGTGTITARLRDHSQLTGRIDAAALSLAAGSRWIVRGNSVITTLADTAKISDSKIANITGDGHTVTYDRALNHWLHGKTYRLAGGGELKPA
jgi:hypothetical protein